MGSCLKVQQLNLDKIQKIDQLLQINHTIAQKRQQLTKNHKIQIQKQSKWIMVYHQRLWYLGGWKQGFMHGYGQIYDIQSQKLIIGRFNQGIIEQNHAILINKDGSYYQGSIDWKFQPKGRGFYLSIQKDIQQTQHQSKDYHLSLLLFDLNFNIQPKFSEIELH